MVQTPLRRQAPPVQALPPVQEVAVHSHLPLVALHDGVSPEHDGAQVALTHWPAALQAWPAAHEAALHTQVLVDGLQSGVTPEQAGRQVH